MKIQNNATNQDGVVMF